MIGNRRLKRRCLVPVTALSLLLLAGAPVAPAFGASSRPLKSVMMGVLGDSISAATLADIPHPSAPVSSEEEVREWARRQLEERAIFENKQRLSWASGTEVRSHFVRLREHLRRIGERRELRVENVAFPGDESDDLPGQAQKLVDRARFYRAVKYVTLLIGANDACSRETEDGTPLPRFRRNLLATFRKLSEIRQEEPLRVLLLAIPRIPELGDPGFRDARTVFGLTCERVRNRILHFCDPLLLWRTPEEYDRKMVIIERINAELRSVAQEASREFPTLEIAYSDALSNHNIPLNVMAADCFHPGEFGHRRLAEETWAEQPWFD